MKIIKHGNQIKELKFICPKCGCVFVSLETEILKVDGNEFVHCPECMYKISYQKEINEREVLYQKIEKEILDFIDFEKINKVMNALDWKWATSKSDTGIPTIDELKEQVKYLLRYAWDHKTSVGTGGFFVSYEDEDDSYTEGLKIIFELEGCAAYKNKKEDFIEIF